MIKKKKKALITIIILILILSGLAWLGITIALFTLVYTATLHYIGLIQNQLLRKMTKGIFLFVFLLSIIINVKLFAFDIYKIPSSSMENLLYPGDVIVVNKLIYGPRLPRSPFEIPTINLAFYMNIEARSRIKDNWWEYSRLDGTVRIKQGDVFVFNSTWDKNYILIKRCVALPGDTLLIKKGEIYTNSIPFNSPETVKNRYSFRVKNKKTFYEIIDSIPIGGYISYDNTKRNSGSAIFSKEQFEFLKKKNCIDSVSKNIDVYASQQELLKTPTSKWTLDNMGSIIIPKKGMEIKLNPENYMLYGNVINQCEKSILSEKKGHYFVNEKETISYKFKLDYFFMMGDNRKETMDSRVWGFVPEYNIIGKVQGTLISNRNEEFQWDRLFKIL